MPVSDVTGAGGTGIGPGRSAAAPGPRPVRAAAFGEVPHGFFTREGGVSEGAFASLNCSMSSGDNADALRENRRRVAAAVGVEAACLLGVTQVHGDAVVTARAAWAPGEGGRADAMVTDRPGLALGVITADCAPVLFLDPAVGVVGAAHAGWRGAAGGILERTLDAMTALGASVSRVVAVVGPCIGPHSYEVGPELRETVRAAEDGFDPDRFFRAGRGDRLMFDLPGYCVARLRAAGVDGAGWTGDDTLADEARFFSHRRRTLAGGGPLGHQISVIASPSSASS
ncbi:peptidoglycan editing factor PgeF [Rhizosaccharibacter radicis]|uniref:Purine nucleoside phosphorylase n=1 Tax=Rhizosaccharibacter radicis TaxID=2782605 RepID=A0ABT1VZF3_9PROT|nr:peptidoglycan editing factor PgeF [Acetobacteraceae bacterium KSS12]